MYTGVTKTMVGHLYQAHPVQIVQKVGSLVEIEWLGLDLYKITPKLIS